MHDRLNGTDVHLLSRTKPSGTQLLLPSAFNLKQDSNAATGSRSRTCLGIGELLPVRLGAKLVVVSCSRGTCSLESLRRPERRVEPADGVEEAALAALDLCVEAAQVLP